MTSVHFLYFFLGLVGALLTVYLARHVVIPEARPFIDIAPIEQDVQEARKRIASIRGQLDNLRALLVAQPVNSSYLTRVVRTLEQTLRDELSWLDRNERRIFRTQFGSRLLGTAWFILLGGIFAALFTDQIQIGLQGQNGASLPKYFQAVVIGAGWTGLLSVFGIRGIQKMAGMSMDQLAEQSTRRIDDLQTSLVGRIRAGQPAQANAAVPTAPSPTAAQMEAWVVEESEQAKRDLSSHLARAHAALRHSI